MKNRILFFVMFFCFITKKALSSDNIQDMVAELSKIPLHKNGNNFENLNIFLKKKIQKETKNKGDRINDQDAEFENPMYKKFVNIIDSWPRQVKSEEDYVHLIYRYFKLIYDNDEIMHFEEYWDSDAFTWILLYKQEKGLFKRWNPVFSNASKEILSKLSAFVKNNEDFKEFVRDNCDPLRDDLRLIKMFHSGNLRGLWRYRDNGKTLIFSDNLADGSKNSFYPSTFSNLFKSISQPSEKEDKSNKLFDILYQIKKIENEMLWRDLLFYFDLDKQLTLDYVIDFFNATMFEGKQFKDIKTVGDISALINDRITFFKKKLELFSSVNDKYNSLKEEDNISNHDRTERAIDISLKLKDVTPFFLTNEFSDFLYVQPKVEIENLTLRIAKLQELLKEYNNLKSNKKLYWGVGIGISSVIVASILIALKKAGYSLDPRTWWQKYKNR